MANLHFREENKLGSDLSDNDGDADRTYTLACKNPVQLTIHLNNIFLHQDQDYTLSDTEITFINKVFNAQPIAINYYTNAATVDDE